MKNEPTVSEVLTLITKVKNKQKRPAGRRAGLSKQTTSHGSRASVFKINNSGDKVKTLNAELGLHKFQVL